MPGGTCENVKPVLFSAVAWAVSVFPGSLGESKPGEETVLVTDPIGLSLTGELTTFSFSKFSPAFCSTFCSFIFNESTFCSVLPTSILLGELLDGIGASRSSSNSGKSSNTAILKPGFRDLAAETKFPKMVGLSGETTFDDPSFVSFSLPFFKPFNS